MIQKVAKPSDIPQLVLLDKYSEFPRDSEWWQKVTGVSSMTMVELIKDNSDNTICYCLHQGHYLEHEFYADRVVGLLVHPRHRRKKIATAVMESIRSRLGPSHKIQAVVPEYSVYEDRGLKEFFDSLEMEAVGLVGNVFTAYGDKYDGIIFEGSATPPKGLLC